MYKRGTISSLFILVAVAIVSLRLVAIDSAVEDFAEQRQEVDDNRVAGQLGRELLNAIEERDMELFDRAVHALGPHILYVRSENGLTPLHYAAMHGLTEVVRSLLACGVDVNDHLGGGGTPLHYAVNRGLVEVVELLLVHGADVNIPINHVRFSPCIQDGEEVSRMEVIKRPPLYFAWEYLAQEQKEVFENIIQRRDIPSLRFLCKYGGDDSVRLVSLLLAHLEQARTRTRECLAGL